MKNDDSGKNGHPVNPSDEKYGIILPCEPEDFGDFISNLLGKPQTIERNLYGAFEIRKEDIVNTYHLVNQRIHQQNEAILVQFTIRIIYDDDSSILLNSLEDFQHYTEVRPITSVGVTLSWSYLIKFKNKNAPEKQEIDLSFQSGIDESEEITIEDDVIVETRRSFWSNSIFLRISHTERTWGVDIESLLTNHVKGYFKTRKDSERFVSRHSGEIGFLAAIIIFLSAIAGVLYTSSKFISSYTEKIEALGNSAIEEAEVISAKLDFLINVISTGAWPRFVFAVVVFLVICLVISIFLGTWVGSTASSKPKSFILLSRKAEESRTKIINKMKRDWLLFWVSVITSIGTGILANVIFAKFFSGVT